MNIKYLLILVMYLGSYKRIFLVLLVVWFTINLIQALFMEILGDEAYYKLYSEYLDWGYFDHPPMVALMIRASSFAFSGNLGVRFITVLLQLGTLALIWMTLDKKEPDSRNVFTFFIIAGSISMFSGYGVIATPDAPLLFFTALFLFTYKKFIGSQKCFLTLLLSVAMAGLVYSKYQAALVIGFAVLSNPSLLKNMRFWFAGILALAILSFHFYWQFSYDFPSFQYHLVDRLENFELKHVIEFLPYQMITLNPFTFAAAVFVLIKYAPSGLFQRSLYFQIIGFVVFFWLISFRDHVEPNWTIACSIPMIILLTERSTEDPGLYKYIRKFILPSILLLLGIRIILMTNTGLTRSLGYSGKKEKCEFIETVAKDLPVIFAGSFQAASLYHFFTGKDAAVLSSVYTRKTQFDIWQFEKKYHNKPVFISSAEDRRAQVFRSGNILFSGFKTDSLQTVNRMKITYGLSEDVFRPGDSIRFSFTLQNTYDYSIDFNYHQFPSKVSVAFKGNKETKRTTVQDVSLSEPVGVIMAGQILKRNLIAVVPELEDGDYRFGICLNTIFGPTYNSRLAKISIRRH